MSSGISVRIGIQHYFQRVKKEFANSRRAPENTKRVVVITDSQGNSRNLDAIAHTDKPLSPPPIRVSPGFPLAKRMIPRNYYFKHPRYGRLTLYVCGKESNAEQLKIIIRRQHNGVESDYQQDMLFSDYDEACNGRSTLTFGRSNLTSGIKNLGGHPMLLIAAADALLISGAGQLVSGEESINNSIIDISRLKHQCNKILNSQGWQDG